MKYNRTAYNRKVKAARKISKLASKYFPNANLIVNTEIKDTSIINKVLINSPLKNCDGVENCDSYLFMKGVNFEDCKHVFNNRAYNSSYIEIVGEEDEII